LGTDNKGIGFIDVSPLISPIGNSIEEVAGPMNIFQYSEFQQVLDLAIL